MQGQQWCYSQLFEFLQIVEAYKNTQIHRLLQNVSYVDATKLAVYIDNVGPRAHPEVDFSVSAILH